MSLTHLARILRPKLFRDIVGQEIPVKMVQNALAANNMRPVCVIFGPSGVGKTTLARLIALWQCCTGERLHEPCGSCVNCEAILNDIHPDVVELDGGTCTSVENIKAMLATTQYTTATYNLNDKKVYILDEVHMISKHAMTALLKEFEKDLTNIQFILATTNIDKLPVAIISRALQLRLDSVSDEKIGENLKKVALEADYSIDEGSVSAIVYAAHGSVRQSLSLLEQVALWSTKIEVNSTENILGIISFDIVKEIIQAFENHSIDELFAVLDKIKEVNPETVVAQVLSEINKKIANKTASDILISVGYELAEAAILIHNFPYSNNLLHITFGHALSIHKEEKPRLSDLARKLFD